MITTEATSDPRTVLELAPELLDHRIPANVVLPLLRKQVERLVTQPDSSDVSRPPPTHTSTTRWYLLFTQENSPANHRRLDLLAAVTSNRIGEYPLFIFCPHDELAVTYQFLEPRIRRLVEAMYSDSLLSRRRVFAVFARADLARAFATSWSTRSGIATVAKPYYSAVLATASRSSIDVAARPCQSDDISSLCRAAELTDIAEAAEFCKAFADDSIIYSMTSDAARIEAEGYIRDRSLYVCEIETGGVRRIASIVAVTRNAHPYAFVTKVFTAPEYRGKGIVQRLVRWTCDHYFTALGYEYVSLYVDLANIPAARAYKNVGFYPIRLSTNDDDSGADVMEEWLEIGFDVAETDIGSW